MLNGRARYLATVRGEAVDFLPRTPILMQYAAEHIGSDYAALAADHRVLTRANEVCAREFGMDQVSCISDSYRETQGFGAHIEYLTDGPPRSTHPLQDHKDLSVLLKPDPLVSVRMLDRVQAARHYGAHLAQDFSVLGWVEGPAAEASDLRGVTPFLMDLLDDEAFVGDLMDLCTEVAIAFGRAQVEAGAETIGIGDAIASQVDPGTYERLIQPREKRLVGALQEAGALVKLHICGNTSHLLPGIADLGVDILDVDHMVSLRQVRDAVGEGLVLTGNLDPVEVMLKSSPGEIRDAVREAYGQVGNPYMVNAGCEIPSGTPVENLRALCEPVAYQR
ncbi:MAG: uroporphyrinogen decarboxylase family protein [Candidatus Latescibacteria bacterium]|jgi:MtaA/CmuA family methyltransferase|nr:hypothetical protein [Gemmatimonadaceae bacterium]MDP6018712.1 uroporphyrinogen decarboxylase family protein [Candidatus Latescibacterota bacterium]|tara:strand:- start:105 stop:1109 length:1005 start_codon:yes stop_codon:yes gene_type:complete